MFCASRRRRPRGGSVPAFNHAVAIWFHDHHGIATTTELAALGIEEQRRRELLAAGVLERLFEGVYRLTSSPLTFEARCRAVCAADESLTLCCFTAGALMGWRRCGTRWIHCMTCRLAKPVGRSVRVHRTRLDLDDHIVTRVDGIRHTDAPQTFFDLARHVSDLDLRSIGEQIIADGLATHAELADHVSTVASRGRPGSGRALRVIAERPTKGGASESHDEVVLLDALHRAGHVEFVRHPPVQLRNGDVVHPDLGVPEVGLYVEVDHPTWHDATERASYDKWRDMEIRLLGGEVDRIPSRRVTHDLPAVVADLAERLRQRRALLQVGAQLR